MATVAQVVDRTYREWLNLPDDQPVVLTLTDAVTDADTTFNYSGSTVAPDEEELLAVGVLVEVGEELCRITGSDLEANTLTVLRGVSGTTATAHASGAEVVASPAYSRHAVTEAVKDAVVGLYPSLWHLKTESLTTDRAPVEVPANFITPAILLVQDASDRWHYAPLPQVLNPFPLSSTGKAVQFGGLAEGRETYLTYRARFSRPASSSDDLADFGVDEQWERILAVSAAAQVVASRPADPLTAEYLTQQLEREVLPPGAAQDIRNGLLTLRQLWLEEAERALRADQDHAVVYRDVPVGRM